MIFLWASKRVDGSRGDFSPPLRMPWVFSLETYSDPKLLDTRNFWLCTFVNPSFQLGEILIIEVNPLTQPFDPRKSFFTKLFFSNLHLVLHEYEKNLITFHHSSLSFPEVTNVSVYGVFVDVGAVTWTVQGLVYPLGSTNIAGLQKRSPIFNREIYTSEIKHWSIFYVSWC